MRDFTCYPLLVGLQQRLHLPVIDQGAPGPADLEAACQYLQEGFSDPETRIYIHCRAGMERTATVLIAYHARVHSLGYDEASCVLKQRALRCCRAVGWWSALSPGFRAAAVWLVTTSEACKAVKP